MPAPGLSDVSVFIATGLALLIFFNKRLLASGTWRATVTPLASIIGSGFLVLAPILVREFGGGAIFAMAGLCLASYLIGGAIRWNIAALEKTGGKPPAGPELAISRISSGALGFAYVISVCYYLNLLGAFLVRLTPFNTPQNGRIATSAALLLIAGIGWFHGLKGLERSEQVSVGVKLAIIAGLLAGMAYHAIRLAGQGLPDRDAAGAGWHGARIAFGLLITVQGFETSRYLKEEHDAATRIATMRYAQWISTGIYLLFIGLASVMFRSRDVGASETAIIGMMRSVAPILPFLLVLAALAAQFSAAVADTNGCGGMAQEVSRGRIPSRAAYVGVAVASLGLTWTADIYQIISYASRAFAAYYALQCALAFLLARRAGRPLGAQAGYALLTLLSLAVLVFGIPAE